MRIFYRLFLQIFRDTYNLVMVIRRYIQMILYRVNMVIKFRLKVHAKVRVSSKYIKLHV